VTRDESPNLDRADDDPQKSAPSAPEAGPPATPPPVADEHDARRTCWREALSVATELAGIAVLSAGFWLIRPWAGLIVFGTGLIVLGFASSPRFNQKNEPQ
jgi:hypothetical protein